MPKLFKKGFEAPFLNLKPYMCAKYARLSAELMSGNFYTPANAWDLHKNNSFLRKTDNYVLTQSTDILVPKSSIVTFYDPSSSYNNKNRIATHAMLYLGKLRGDLWFAEQRKDKQRIINLEDIKSQDLEAKGILGF